MRLYALEEARALLPLVRPVLLEIQRAYVRLRALQAAKAADARAARADGHLLVDLFEATAAEGEVDELQSRLRDGTQRLESWGIELKDPARGLIDFYHERDSQVVYLCYHLQESDITSWHTLEGGFAGRRPLSELP